MASDYHTKAADRVDASPNVILVVVDDLGWMDLSCQGSELQNAPHRSRGRPKEFAFLTDMQRVLSAHQRVLRFRTGRYPHAWGYPIG